jgi:3-hydroxyisobutyrate dehydrogenase-like beta-hydroxyacid dehydrogenase
MDIGFIGLGQMGKAIATNLLRAGHALRVWNRTASVARELGELGARPAADPAEAARGEVLFSMLSDDAAHRSVLLDTRLLEHASSGLIHVNLATVSVALARELAQLEARHTLSYVAAPVFGRPEAAAAAKLHVVVAGAPTAVKRIEPLLAVIGQRTWAMGEEPARANAVKLAGNFMIASAIETMGEAAALVQAHGVGAGEFLEILTGTLFASPAYQTYGKLIAERRFLPAGFTMELGLKDVHLALEAGEAARVPLPFAAVLRDHFLEALATGGGSKDWCALAEIAARHAGLAPDGTRQEPSR